MLLGFSSGCLYKTHDGLAQETFDIFKKSGSNAIEIMCHGIADLPRLLEISPEDLRGFEHVSLHAPILGGTIPEAEMRRVLGCIEEAHRKLGFAYVVIHPDTVTDWKIFTEFAIPFAVENMDNRKKSCRNVEDLRKVFAQSDLGMVLDVNHCFSNDPTMQLASDLIAAFRERIVGFHLSGFETFHDLLYKTQQQEILDAVFDTKLPIIIESGCELVTDVAKEYEYIKNKLS
jgi:hypothetical protein